MRYIQNIAREKGENMNVSDLISLCKDIILNEKDNIIFIIIWMFMLSVCCVRAIHTTSIEEIFMTNKNKLKNDVYKLIFIWVILIPKNLFLAIDNLYIVFGLAALFESYIAHTRFRKKEEQIIDKSDTGLKLKRYYKDKQTQTSLRWIMYSMPIMTILFREMRLNSSLFICAIVTSVFEVAILAVSTPELIIKKSMNYYKNGQDRIFLYKRLENDTFLCGDSEDISEATKYIIKSFDELKTEQILNLKDKKLSKVEIKALRKELKKTR